jgi:hypothetical protein
MLSDLVSFLQAVNEREGASPSPFELGDDAPAIV